MVRKSRKRKAEGLERHKQIKRDKETQRKQRKRVELPAKHRKRQKR